MDMLDKQVKLKPQHKEFNKYQDQIFKAVFVIADHPYKITKHYTLEAEINNKTVQIVADGSQIEQV